MYTSKKLFQMDLDDISILRLTQNFEQIIITQEVESWEFGSLLFQKVVQCLLASFELIQNHVKCILNTWNHTQTNNLWVSLDTEHDTSELIIKSLESWLLLREGTSTKNRLQIDPLPLNNVQLGQIIINTSQLLFKLFNLILESIIKL